MSGEGLKLPEVAQRLPMLRQLPDGHVTLTRIKAERYERDNKRQHERKKKKKKDQSDQTTFFT